MHCLTNCACIVVARPLQLSLLHSSLETQAASLTEINLQEVQSSGGMALFPSLDLERMKTDSLPSVNLDTLLDPSYSHYPAT